MRLLFVHQNFPGQYRHLAAHYAAQKGNVVVGIGEKANDPLAMKLANICTLPINLAGTCAASR